MKLPKGINAAEVARRMGKSRQWLYQRLNGNLVNGKPATFTRTELGALVFVVGEMAVEIGEWAKTRQIV